MTTSLRGTRGQARNTEAERQACEIRLRAERRVGERLVGIAKVKGAVLRPAPTAARCDHAVLSRGPATMLPAIERIRKSVSCHVAALPVPYRTTPDQPTFQSLKDPACTCLPEGRPFPVALDPFTCNRYEIAEFAKAAFALGVRYLGVCCGAGPHHIRALAEALGRSPPASRYSPDMSRHSYFGTDPKITTANREYAARL